jgi:hypothetical protein
VTLQIVANKKLMYYVVYCTNYYIVNRLKKKKNKKGYLDVALPVPEPVTWKW